MRLPLVFLTASILAPTLAHPRPAYNQWNNNHQPLPSQFDDTDQRSQTTSYGPSHQGSPQRRRQRRHGRYISRFNLDSYGPRVDNPRQPFYTTQSSDPLQGPSSHHHSPYSPSSGHSRGQELYNHGTRQQRSTYDNYGYGYEDEDEDDIYQPELVLPPSLSRRLPRERPSLYEPPPSPPQLRSRWSPNSSPSQQLRSRWSPNSSPSQQLRSRWSPNSSPQQPRSRWSPNSSPPSPSPVQPLPAPDFGTPSHDDDDEDDQEMDAPIVRQLEGTGGIEVLLSTGDFWRFPEGVIPLEVHTRIVADIARSRRRRRGRG